MENVTELELEKVPDFLQNLKYGSNLLTPYDEMSCYALDVGIEVLNEILGPGAVEQKPAIENELIGGEWVEKKLPGVYNVLYKLRGVDVPLLDLSNYDLNSQALRAGVGKSRIYLVSLHPKLIKLAKRTAKTNGVKFGFDTNGDAYFDGSIKGQSVSKQIQAALESGSDKIEFDAINHNIVSIRCYASMLKSTTGKPVKCTIKNGIITVSFKEASPEEKFINDMNRLTEEFSLKHTKERAVELLYELAESIDNSIRDNVKETIKGFQEIIDDKMEIINSNLPVTAWKKYGFGSEQEYIEFVGLENVEYLSEEEKHFDDFNQ